MEVVAIQASSHKSALKSRTSLTRWTKTVVERSTHKSCSQLWSMAKGRTSPTRPALWWFRCSTRTSREPSTSWNSRNSSITSISGLIASKPTIATNPVPSKKLSLVRPSLRWVSASASSSSSSWFRSTTQQRGKSPSTNSSCFAWKSRDSRTLSVNVTHNSRAPSPSDLRISLELHWTAPTKIIRSKALASATASSDAYLSYSTFLAAY